MSRFRESILTVIKKCFNPAVIHHIYLGDSLFFLPGHYPPQKPPQTTSQINHNATPQPLLPNK